MGNPLTQNHLSSPLQHLNRPTRSIYKQQYSKCNIVVRLGLLLFIMNILTILLLYRLWLLNKILQSSLIMGFVLASNLFLICLGTSNPGAIPKQIKNFEFYQQCFLIPKSKTSLSKCTEILLPTATTLSKIKYCEQCNIYRPLRTIHCSICHQCVRQFDHHCQWIGVCIGKANYSLFITTILIVDCATVTILVGSIKCLVSYQSLKLIEFLRFSYWLILITILASIFVLALTGLLLYHFNLLRKGRTTNEDLKKIYGNQLSVFEPWSTWSCKSTKHGERVQQVPVLDDNLETQKRIMKNN